MALNTSGSSSTLTKSPEEMLVVCTVSSSSKGAPVENVVKIRIHCDLLLHTGEDLSVGSALFSTAD